MSAASTDPDFLIVGAGTAGGVVAKELATAGFRVVVLEQGPWLRESDFKHDEIWANRRHALANDHARQPNTRRLTDGETATLQPTMSYGRGVGGGSVHFTANYWRFHELDFVERSRLPDHSRLLRARRRAWPLRRRGHRHPLRFHAHRVALDGLPPETPRWGAGYKQALMHNSTRTMYSLAHTTSLPVETTSISLDPTVRDAWGLPAIRVTFQEHENDQKVYRWFQDRNLELLGAAGAVPRWECSLDTYYPAVHLLGTCRMGNDPARSVVDRSHRAPRCSQPVPGRRQQLRHGRPRPADLHHPGARLPGGGRDHPAGAGGRARVVGPGKPFGADRRSTAPNRTPTREDKTP